jgi:hypothetical protein
MPLDRLAPDQRAVVQLVLQQGRSYDDLANLLGISEQAVRDRAHAGLTALAGGSAAPARAGEVADFLLGQQTVSQRESTRSLLASDPEAHAWATAVSSELRDVAGDDLPEIPAGPRAAAPVAEPEPAADAGPRASVADAPSPTADLGRPRPRPRPLRDADTESAPRPRRAREPRDRGPVAAGDDAPAASRLGGALLIGGLAILVAAILIFVVGNGSGEDDPASGTTTTNAEASPTAEASATPQPLGQIALQKVDGQTGRGVMALFGQAGTGLVFTLAAERVPALQEGEAYAMWLTTDSGNAKLLGFFQEAPQGKDRQLATTGPREEDAAKFASWLTRYDHIVVSKETVNAPKSPTTIVLQGDLPSNAG